MCRTVVSKGDISAIWGPMFTRYGEDFGRTDPCALARERPTNDEVPLACASRPRRQPSPRAMTHMRWLQGRHRHENTDCRLSVVLCVIGSGCACWIARSNTLLPVLWRQKNTTSWNEPLDISHSKSSRARRSPTPRFGTQCSRGCSGSGLAGPSRCSAH